MARLSEFKFNLSEFYNKHKYITLTLLFLVIVALLTGVFTAIKMYRISSNVSFEDFSFITLYNGSIYDFSVFVKRFLSALIVVGIILLSSINKYLNIIGCAVICYRAFLLSLNCAFIVMLLGLGGALNAILIIFPCNIICILLMLVLFILCVFGCKGDDKSVKFKYSTLIMVCILILNIVEWLLLIIFKPTTILII